MVLVLVAQEHCVDARQPREVEVPRWVNPQLGVWRQAELGQERWVDQDRGVTVRDEPALVPEEGDPERHGSLAARPGG